jgi:hypothetical protein
MRKLALPLGLLVFGSVFVSNGVRLIRAEGQGDLPRIVLALLGLGAVAIGFGLWRRDSQALTLYWVWAGLSLALSAWQDLWVAGEHIAVVALWLALIGALYVALGLYLRDAVRAARGEEPRPQAG